MVGGSGRTFRVGDVRAVMAAGPVMRVIGSGRDAGKSSALGSASSCPAGALVRNESRVALASVDMLTTSVVRPANDFACSKTDCLVEVTACPRMLIVSASLPQFQ